MDHFAGDLRAPTVVDLRPQREAEPPGTHIAFRSRRTAVGARGGARPAAVGRLAEIMGRIWRRGVELQARQRRDISLVHDSAGIRTTRQSQAFTRRIDQPEDRGYNQTQWLREQRACEAWRRSIRSIRWSSSTESCRFRAMRRRPVRTASTPAGSTWCPSGRRSRSPGLRGPAARGRATTAASAPRRGAQAQR